MLNDQVAKVIRMHGGNIAKTFVPAQHYKKQHPVYSDLSSNIVLTDDQRRTTKYMMGVVHSLPCVHYEWVLGCINQARARLHYVNDDDDDEDDDDDDDA